MTECHKTGFALFLLCHFSVGYVCTGPDQMSQFLSQDTFILVLAETQALKSGLETKTYRNIYIFSSIRG